jgi:bifunctional non-homologous end joining protein LigD
MNTSPRTALVVFAHACRLGAEGIVSKKVESTYQSGPGRVWIKVRNPASLAVQRERGEIWNRRARASARQINTAQSAS